MYNIIKASILLMYKYTYKYNFANFQQLNK